MTLSKYILIGLSIINLSDAFLTPYNLNKSPKLSRCNTPIYLSKNKNSSNIFKIRFDNDDKFENDWFNKPKYPLNMTEYDLTLIQIFIYAIINIYILAAISNIYIKNI